MYPGKDEVFEKSWENATRSRASLEPIDNPGHDPHCGCEECSVKRELKQKWKNADPCS